MRIFLSLMMAIIGLSGCDKQTDTKDLEFAHEAVLVKTCGVDQGISTVPLKVYRFNDQLWFKDNSIWWKIDAGIDQVCDVLDIDAQDGNRRSRRDHYAPSADWFTWRMRLVRGF
jgi:hypothetical protein